MRTTAEDHHRSLWVGAGRIDLTRRSGVSRIVPDVTLARAIGAALDAAGATRPASIGLILADDAELAELNERHMGHQRPTDVLSFPLLPPSAYPEHPGQDPEGRTVAEAFALPPGQRPHLGDIVVSVERAVAQATEGRGGLTGDVHWSAEEELRLLVTHGTLHLCGWDHAVPAEEAEMRRLELRLLGTMPGEKRHPSLG